MLSAQVYDLIDETRRRRNPSNPTAWTQCALMPSASPAFSGSATLVRGLKRFLFASCTAIILQVLQRPSATQVLRFV